MKVCKHCGEINTNDCEFCRSCGESVFLFQEDIICSHCGATNDKSFRYCINCGNDMMQPAASVESNIAAEAPVAQQNAPQNTGDDGYTPVPVDLRQQMSEVYGGLSSSTPTETAHCPTCGANVPIHAIYCQACGSPVFRLHEHRVVKRKICPFCGRPNSLESHLCAYCFCSLANADTQEMQLVHGVKNIGDDIVKQAYLEDEHGKKKICSNCGALNPLDELFCVNCGFKLDVEEQKKYCPNCGAEKPENNTFCMRCQWSFDGTAPDDADKWICSKCYGENNGTNKFCVSCGAKRVSGRRK